MRLLVPAFFVLCSGCLAAVDPDGPGTGGGTGTDTGALWVAFDSDRGTVDRDLWAVRADGTELRRLTDAPGTDQHPAFSPDGRKLAFVSDRNGALDVHVMLLADRSVTQLTHGGGARNPSWSADGRTIVFARDSGIFTADAVSGAERLVTSSTPGLSGGAWRYPVFSPNGLTIAADATYALYAMNAQGGQASLLVPITAAGEVHPSYAPTGAHLAFAQYVGDGLDAIFVMPARGLTERASNPGSGAKRLTPEGAPSSTNPAWSGTRIVYEQGTTDADLMIIPDVGGTAVALTSGTGDDRNAAWAPPGTSLPPSL